MYDDESSTIEIRPWLVHRTCAGFRLSSAAQLPSRPSVGVFRDMSSHQPGPPRYNVRSQPRRNMSRLLQEEQPNLPGLRPASRLWEREDTTCLSIRLNPSVPGHQPFVCSKCNNFWEAKLKFGAIPYTERSTSRRYLCERPFSYDGTHEQKRLTCERIRQLFSGDAVSAHNKT